jgi:putative Holliday junction resolvase
VLGVDYGAKRIGLALSDATGSLARPWQMVRSPGDPRSAAETVSGVVATLRGSDDPDLDRIVVGLPRRLNGEQVLANIDVKEGKVSRFGFPRI